MATCDAFLFRRKDMPCGYHLGQVSVLINPLCPALVALASRGCALEQTVDGACECRLGLGADDTIHRRAVT